jgi:hypothetical protein
MIPVLTDLEINLIVAVVVGGVCLSPLGTKLTDWFKGIPGDVRTALNGVEKTTTANIKASVASAKAHALAALPVPAAKPVVVTAAVTAAAPAAAPPVPAAPAA